MGRRGVGVALRWWGATPTPPPSLTPSLPQGSGREDTVTKIYKKNNLVYMLSPISCCYYKIININTITIT